MEVRGIRVANHDATSFRNFASDEGEEASIQRVVLLVFNRKSRRYGYREAGFFMQVKGELFIDIGEAMAGEQLTLNFHANVFAIDRGKVSRKNAPLRLIQRANHGGASMLQTKTSANRFAPFFPELAT